MPYRFTGFGQKIGACRLRSSTQPFPFGSRLDSDAYYGSGVGAKGNGFPS